ncbi:MAG: 30S ribosomal protein S6 [Myxococcales bacterium]|mgnify:CR=1 FL=1|nr:30S ribosomal protein S6 [Myxococcales bacterium]
MQTEILKSREYETIYILKPDVDAESAEKVQSRVSEVIGRDAGKLVKVESWGRRKLAYPVQKNKKGVYMYVKYIGRGGLVAELERNLKLADAVLKFQTVKLDHDVDMEAVTVDPEEVKLQKLDLPAEDEAEESREKQLGLVDAPMERSHRSHSDDGARAGADDESGDEGTPSAAPAAKDAPAKDDTGASE